MLSDEPRERAADGEELIGLLFGERPRGPIRHAQHARHAISFTSIIGSAMAPSSPVARAPGPHIAAGIRLDVADADRLAALGGEPGHAFADRHHANDLDHRRRNARARRTQMKLPVRAHRVDGAAVGFHEGEDGGEGAAPVTGGGLRFDSAQQSLDHASISLTTLPCTSVSRMSRPAVAEGEALVIQAQQVQHGGVQVVHVDFVLDGVVAELVGGSVYDVRP